MSLENWTIYCFEVLEESLAVGSTEHLLRESPGQARPLPILVTTPAVRNNVYRVLSEGHSVHHSF